MLNNPTSRDDLAETSATASGSTEADDTQALPVLPGTESPRSLGDLMREAELASGVDAKVTAAKPDQATDSSVDNAQGHKAGRSRKPKKPSRAQSRRFARERALQALYQWDVSDAQSTTVRQEFLDMQDMSRVDVDYFVLLYNGVSHAPQSLDDTLQDFLDRPVANLDPIERAVLRIAAFELRERPDIPARVVINEGIEITKRFGADKGHHYVNGVLDKLAMSLRAPEMRAR